MKRLVALMLSVCLLAGCGGGSASASSGTETAPQPAPTAAPQPQEEPAATPAPVVKSSAIPRTGDAQAPAVWVCLLGVSAIGCAALRRKKR